jgi:hypothetical protein
MAVANYNVGFYRSQKKNKTKQNKKNYELLIVRHSAEVERT